VTDVRRGPQRVLAMCRRAGLPILLIGLAAGLLLTPISRSRCPAAFRALTAGMTSASKETPPPQDPDEAAADTRAVAQAHSELDALSEEETQAEALEAAAQNAEEAAQSAESDSWLGVGYELESAESDVEMDQDAVTAAEDSLASAKNDDYSWYPELQESDIAQAQDSLERAREALTESRKNLADLREKSASASKLKTRAEKARAKADGAHAALAGKLSMAQEAVSTAEQKQRDHVNVHLARVASWTHDHRIAERKVKAHNAVVNDCRREARGSTAAAGALALGGISLPLLPWLGRLHVPRRRRRRSKSA
jgi:DNA repair exonuclease SbcCD ATPase subunit